MIQLQLISGIVSDLIVAKGYDDPVFNQADKSVAGGAAVVAVAVGEFFSSAVASSSQGAEIDVEYFRCTINGLAISGHFYRVGFKDGDEMEFVIEQEAGNSLVHGARSPTRRLIWMLPHQTRGFTAQKKNNTKWRIGLSLLSSAVGFILLMSALTPDIKLPLWFIPANLTLAFFISLAISFMVTRRFDEFSVQATEVLHAFGYENATSVDLPARSRLAEKKWKMQESALPEAYQPWRFRY